MGFFDRFKKTSDKTVVDDVFLKEIVAAYGLKKAKPYEPSLEQDWWEGHYAVLRFAVQEHGAGMVVYLGDITEVTDIYLGRTHPGKPIPANSAQRLDRIVGPEGAELAGQFVLLAYPKGNFDFPQLRLPELLHGIPRLSRSVEEIGIYENFRGISLILRQPLNRTEFDSDLAIASGIVKALSSWTAKTVQR